MKEAAPVESLIEVNARANRLRGLGPWRKLYRELLTRLSVRSILEVGSGDAAFLASLPRELRRVAIDGNAALAPHYAEAGIEFHAFDFDNDPPPAGLVGFDVAVCSDVFEHLLYPQQTLKLVASALTPQGILFSHVPNEFRLGAVVKTMLGRSSSVHFHTDCDEWQNPHLRRFTDAGYRRFLALAFEHSVKINDLDYSRLPRLIDRLGLPVPYCLEGGPTYASTNDRKSLEALVLAKEDVRQTR